MGHAIVTVLRHQGRIVERLEAGGLASIDAADVIGVALSRGVAGVQHARNGLGSRTARTGRLFPPSARIGLALHLLVVIRGLVADARAVTGGLD
jgi:hypothetical protein